MLLIRIYCEVGEEYFNEFTHYTEFSIGDWGSNLTKEEVLREFFGAWGDDDEDLMIIKAGDHTYQVGPTAEPKYCKLIAYDVTEEELKTLSKFNVIDYGG